MSAKKAGCAYNNKNARCGQAPAAQLPMQPPAQHIDVVVYSPGHAQYYVAALSGVALDACAPTAPTPQAQRGQTRFWGEAITFEKCEQAVFSFSTRICACVKFSQNSPTKISSSYSN